MNDNVLIRSYGLVSHVAAPFSRFWLKKRVRSGKEDPQRIDERHGKTAAARPKGDLIWLHGASVGETLMLMPIVRRILRTYPKANVLITSQTVTSAEMLEKQLPARALHQYAPLDYPGAVKRFLDHWRPDLAIFGESEIWPNLIRNTNTRQIPLALINARMSEKSLEGWNKHKKLAKDIFEKFDLILAADLQTANGLAWLTGQSIESAGNLKDAAPALPADMRDLQKMQAAIGGRPVWVAASTHRGEDELIIAAHKTVLERFPDALLILSPRHPERTSDITSLLKKARLKYVRRKTRKTPGDQTQVFVIDTMGDMGLAFRLSQIAFICGSLIDGMAGHNPLEPARLDNAVMTGMYISSFADTYMSMIAHNAAQRILTPGMIAPSIIELLEDKDALEIRQSKAKQFASGRDEVLDYVWNELTPLMPIMVEPS